MKNIYVLIEHLRGGISEISYMMLAAANDLADKTGASVSAVILGQNPETLAGDLAAGRVLMARHDQLAEYNPEAYLKVLVSVLEDRPDLFLFGDTSIGAELAGALSAASGCAQVSACREFSLEGEEIIFTSQICGGKLLARGTLPAGQCVLVTMVPGAFKADQGRISNHPGKYVDRELIELPIPDLSSLRIRLREYIEPETADVDITRQDVLVAVGRGIKAEGDIELAQELAEVLGGSVSASRPVVDQGWLPISRLVGKSGLSVSPKLYLALGISGAPEHVEAITGSEIIIAVNTDETAPIFNLAHYGAVVDLFDLVPALVDQVRLLKDQEQMSLA